MFGENLLSLSPKKKLKNETDIKGVCHSYYLKM